MKFAHLAGALAFATLAFAPAWAADPAPAGSTGLCKDGSYTESASKRGACSGHGGVKKWYGKAGASKKAAKDEAKAEAPAQAKPSRSAEKAEREKAERKEAPASSSAPSARNEMPAAGGGAGKVWVNTDSHVYHCSGDRWYGKTKKGEYMSESAAKAQGNRADHGKGCA
jgi:hypothetical protein